MRLSDAVMMGYSLIKFNPTTFLTDGCGCLIGAGFAAATGRRDGFSDEMVRIWPWLKQEFATPDVLGVMKNFAPVQEAKSIIGQMAIGVSWNDQTLEQAVDWIRSVEPPDPSELLKEVDDAVGEHPEHQDVPMDIYERWERSAPERQG